MARTTAIVIGSILMLSNPAATRAQVSLDVAKITCEQFILFKITDPRNIALWLSGYYNAKRNNSVIDPQALTRDTDKVRQYCRMNLEAPVMQAVEATLTDGK
jgi:acid stress chaperone HdeB